MKSIKESIEQIASSSKFMSNFENLKKDVMANPHIQAFLMENPTVTEGVLNRDLSKAFEFMNGQKHCDNCPGLANCPNILKGYQPDLFVDRQALGVKYEPCHLKIAEDQKKHQSELIKSYYVPKEILSATFDKIDKKEAARYPAIKAAADFVKNYQRGEREKGLYLNGEFGVGKTYIMGAIMNALAERMQVESLMVYTPDFFRELKGSITDQTLDEKLDYIKKVPLLIFDDIGAETMSPWIRDDILGSVLQHRIMDGLPTLFTSNYDFDELEDHLAYSHKTGTELLKAKRIMERIKYYSVSVSVEGKNRRSF